MILFECFNVPPDDKSRCIMNTRYHLLASCAFGSTSLVSFCSYSGFNTLSLPAYSGLSPPCVAPGETLERWHQTVTHFLHTSYPLISCLVVMSMNWYFDPLWVLCSWSLCSVGWTLMSSTFAHRYVVHWTNSWPHHSQGWIGVAVDIELSWLDLKFATIIQQLRHYTILSIAEAAGVSPLVSCTSIILSQCVI